MRIDQVTKYRCNACGIEQANPIGWVSLLPLSGYMVLQTGVASTSEDYCSICIGRMRQAVKGLE